MRSIAWLILALLLTGCAHYEYDLVRPADLAQHVGTKQDSIVPVPPLEYRLIAYDDHLVLRIFNPTDDAIELLGPQSSVVDPDGQSHPLRSQTAAPHSFIKVILPPIRPRYYNPYGPAVGFGFGSAVIVHEHRGYSSDPVDDALPAREVTPRYESSYYDDGDSYFWSWSGQTDVRLMLAFQRDSAKPELFRHEFLFHRVKM